MYGHYNIRFQDGSTFRLHGEDYFGDRVEFSRDHERTLVAFSLEVCKKGIPVSVYSSYEDKVIEFHFHNNPFEVWYLKNQSYDLDFGFADISGMANIFFEAKKRIELMIVLLEHELYNLKTFSFNRWKLMSGYRNIIKQTQLSLCSLKQIKQKGKYLNDLEHSKIDMLIEYFLIPSKIKVDSISLTTVQDVKFDDLDKEVLIKLCQINLKELKKIRDEKLSKQSAGVWEHIKQRFKNG